MSEEEEGKLKKKLFIEELEERKSSSPLFVAPCDPSNVVTTFAVGEEGGTVTTEAIGEEGGFFTTHAVGEEGGYTITTFAIGEEGGILK